MVPRNRDIISPLLGCHEVVLKPVSTPLSPQLTPEGTTGGGGTNDMTISGRISSDCHWDPFYDKGVAPQLSEASPKLRGAPTCLTETDG